MTEEIIIQKKEFMAFPFEIKEVEDSGEFTGYASTFNNMDLGRDIMMPGAFSKTLKQNKGVVPVLADHDSWNQIGWGQTGAEDEKGLLVTGALNMEVQKARERHALTKQAKKVGGKMGLSIGYIPKVREFDEDKRVRKLIEVDLWEYSFVTFPMNPKASITSMKSLLGDQAMQFTENPRELEGLLREAGFSNSEAKAIASFGIKIHKGEQCEADDSQIQELLEACKSFRLTITK